MLDQADQDVLDADPSISSAVVVGHGSSRDNGQELAHFVTQRRYFVDTFDASAEDADERIQEWVADSLEKPKMFFLVVSQKDVDEGNREWVSSKVLEQARKLLAAFGKGRVILVVEAGIIDFDYNSGLDDILFPPGDLGSTYRSVAAFLVREFGSEGNAGPGSGKPKLRTGAQLEREPLETDVKMAIALLALAAIFGGIYMIRLFIGDSTEAAVSDVGGVELTLPVDTEVAGPTVTQPPTTTSGVPFVATLPATCQVELARATILPSTILCENGGGLRVTGYQGPWHNAIARIGLESQVSGSVMYEETGETVFVGPGVTNLDTAGAQFGVQEMVFQFEADGKKVQFEEFPTDGQRVVTFTFDASLNRP